MPQLCRQPGFGFENSCQKRWELKIVKTKEPLLGGSSVFWVDIQSEEWMV